MIITFASPRVSPHGVTPEVVLAVVMAAPLFTEYGVDCVITSLTDGLHKSDSLHYKGLAVDLRSRDVAVMHKGKLLEDLRELLPPYYEVYLEDLGGPNEHFHLEYDYKGD